MNDEPREDDSEARSVFVSQLAARLTARDLGYFFEDKLGENTVLDARIVTDRLSRRSKGSVPFSSTPSILTLTLIAQNRLCGVPYNRLGRQGPFSQRHGSDGIANHGPAN